MVSDASENIESARTRQEGFGTIFAFQSPNTDRLWRRPALCRIVAIMLGAVLRVGCLAPVPTRFGMKAPRWEVWSGGHYTVGGGRTRDNRPNGLLQLILRYCGFNVVALAYAPGDRVT
jgi:hypothetical protein